MSRDLARLHCYETSCLGFVSLIERKDEIEDLRELNLWKVLGFSCKFIEGRGQSVEFIAKYLAVFACSLLHRIH